MLIWLAGRPFDVIMAVFLFCGIDTRAICDSLAVWSGWWCRWASSCAASDLKQNVFVPILSNRGWYVRAGRGNI